MFVGCDADWEEHSLEDAAKIELRVDSAIFTVRDMGYFRLGKDKMVQEGRVLMKIGNLE